MGVTVNEKGIPVLDSNTRRTFFMSVGDVLQFVKNRKPVSATQSSLNNADSTMKWYGGYTLEQYMRKCQVGDFPTEIQRIIELSEEIFKKLPSGVSYRRRKEVGSSGSRVRATTITGGNLSRGFVKSVREKTLGNLGVISLIFNASYNSTFTDEQILWQTATVLALGLYIDQQGRQSEIWGTDVTLKGFVDGARDYVTMVRVKASGMPFDLHELSCTVSPAFLRRLLFAVQERQGMVASGYGQPPDQKTMEDSVRALMIEHKIPMETAVFSPDGVSKKVDSIGTATGWIIDQLQKIEV